MSNGRPNTLQPATDVDRFVRVVGKMGKCSKGSVGRHDGNFADSAGNSKLWQEQMLAPRQLGCLSRRIPFAPLVNVTATGKPELPPWSDDPRHGQDR